MSRQYNFNGIAGCVVQRRSRQTRRLVGVYKADQSDLSNEMPWWTVCEDHGYLVGHDSLNLALSWSADPMTWCGVCNGYEEE
jgi:hypothetical protein